MSESENKPKQLEIFTIFDTDYHLVAANYFVVAFTGQGDISIDFMVQNISTPERVIYELDDKRNIGNEIHRYPEGEKMVRRVQSGVLLSCDGALALSDLLQKQVANYKKTLTDR